MRAELNREFYSTKIRKKNEIPERLRRVPTISTIEARQAQPQAFDGMTYCHVSRTIEYVATSIIHVVQVSYIVRFTVHESLALGSEKHQLAKRS